MKPSLFEISCLGLLGAIVLWAASMWAIAAYGSTGALVSDGAASRLHPTGFDPTIAGERP
jgi:hypothetical protein